MAWNNVENWTTVDAEYGSASLVPIIQEIVNRAGWASGNALALLIDGTGTRTARAEDKDPVLAPKLHIEYMGP